MSFLFFKAVDSVCFLYFRRPGHCYSPEGESSAWRRAERGVVDGWTWSWSDTPTWSTASPRKEPSHHFSILSPSADGITQIPVKLLSSELNRVTCFLAELPWRSWTFWTRCQRLKWAWPIRLMANLYQVSLVGHSHLDVFIDLLFVCPLQDNIIGFNSQRQALVYFKLGFSVALK